MSRVLLLLFIFLAHFAFSQATYSTKSKKAIKYYEEAQVLLKQRRINEGIRKLNDALQKDNDFVEAHLRLAFSYELLREMRAQQYHLEQVVRIMPNSPLYKNAYYSLGKVYFNQGKYQEAKSLLLKLESFGIDNPRMKKDVEKLNENISYALIHIKEPIDISPQALPGIVNSFPLQYFPVLTADQNTLIYTSRDGVSFHDDENIVISERDSEGNWSQPVGISPNINSQFNEGTCTISADGRTLIFTNCEGRKRVGSCDLYVSYKIGNEWTVPENLGRKVNSMSWDSQPTLSADGRKLFFISDRAGGYGKRDIWITVKNKEDEWEEAINAGKVINSSEDEVSPFIHVNGTTLFFASTGFPGFGGYDLYRSELQDSTWSEPENLGYPLNTFEDQVSLFVSTDGKTGYYSYERINKNNEKESLLYSFDFPDDGILENRSIYLTGNIYDEESGEPLDARIELFQIGEDEPSSIFTSDPVTGEYFSILTENKKVALYIDRQGYLFQSQVIEIKADDDNAIRKDIYLKPITIGKSVLLDNIFFEINSAKLTDESKTELMKVVDFLQSNPQVRITIKGHTDNQGTEAYNNELSKNRASAVYKFLLTQGIDKFKIRYRGYGESQPVASNDTEDGRKQNRRIEFSIDEISN